VRVPLTRRERQGNLPDMQETPGTVGASVFLAAWGRDAAAVGTGWVNTGVPRRHREGSKKVLRIWI